MDPRPSGYHGCYLRIDVSNGSVERVPLAETVLRQFIGGSGLGAWLLLEESRSCPDALAPEAPLIFVFSPLVGSPLTTSAKFAVVSKSPVNRPDQRLAGRQRIRDRRQKVRMRRPGHRWTGCSSFHLDHRRRQSPSGARRRSCRARMLFRRGGAQSQTWRWISGGRRSVPPANTLSVMRRFLTMAATPDVAAAAPCSAARI